MVGLSAWNQLDGRFSFVIVISSWVPLNSTQNRQACRIKGLSKLILGHQVHLLQYWRHISVIEQLDEVIVKVSLKRGIFLNNIIKSPLLHYLGSGFMHIIHERWCSMYGLRNRQKKVILKWQRLHKASSTFRHKNWSAITHKVVSFLLLVLLISVNPYYLHLT